MAQRLAERLRTLVHDEFSIMEVCGTHTMAIARYGIRSLLPERVRLISGPGCPVCVTSQKDIDNMIDIAARPEVIFCTFGDMMRVPGSDGSLVQAKARGADVRVVYSPLEAVELAGKDNGKKVVFAGVGFETTSPTVAAAVLEADRLGIKNFFVYPAFKLVPPALELVLSSPQIRLDGFLLPGHVSAIIGLKPYGFIASKYGRPGVVAGFEPLDILGAIVMILEMRAKGRPEIKNEYARGVKEGGNRVALGILDKVFLPQDAWWRALGRLPLSGLGFRAEYRRYDAFEIFSVCSPSSDEPSNCGCGQVMLGAIEPVGCPLFGASCTPESPVGPCMVSSEGACAAWYKYGLGKPRRVDNR